MHFDEDRRVWLMVVDRVLIRTRHIGSGSRPVGLTRTKIIHVYKNDFIFIAIF
jgi:hypothetical protein